MLGARPSLDSTSDRALSHDAQKEGRFRGAASNKSKLFKITALLCAITLIVLPSFIFVHFFRAQQHPSPPPPPAQGAGSGGHEHGGHEAVDVKPTTTPSAAKPTEKTTSAPVPSATPSPVGDITGTPSSLNVSMADQLNLNTGFVISDTPTIRNYVFNVSRELGAPDGYEKSMILVNGQSPGPLIEANIGDTIRVVVNNQMSAESTTIHWHGIDQRNTTWMDGVAGVSQCGIPPGESFTYEFELSGQRGTFWYHSHLTIQYVDGLYGPLVSLPTPPPRGHRGAVRRSLCLDYPRSLGNGAKGGR